MSKSKGAHSAHAPGVTKSEFALFCYLRTHADVAATYGITQCHGKTTIGSMLVQTLWAQGMHVEWYERLPNGVDADGTGNEGGAAWIKKVGRRPGARMEQLKDPAGASRGAGTEMQTINQRYMIGSLWVANSLVRRRGHGKGRGASTHSATSACHRLRAATNADEAGLTASAQETERARGRRAR